MLIKRKSIVGLVSAAMVLLISLAIGSLGYLLIKGKYDRFNREIVTFQHEFAAQQKTELKNQVEQAIEFIDYNLSQTQSRGRQLIKERVYEAHQIATAIYETYKTRYSAPQIQEMIITALRPIRFNDGRGYYFILNDQGVFLSDPNLPEVEGKKLADLGAYGNEDFMAAFSRIVGTDSEGFGTYHFHQPGHNPKKQCHKISFIKYFSPYGWYLGSGEYLDHLEESIQKQVADYLNIHRFGVDNQNYVFVIKLLTIAGGKNFGIMYANASRPDLVGKPISDDYPDAKGKLFRQEFLQGLRDKGECYVTYWYKTIDSEKPLPKTSFFKLDQKANLIVAAGAYHPDMEKIIAGKRQELAAMVKQDIVRISLILTAIFLTLMTIAHLITRKIRQEFAVFTSFFSRAASKDEKIANQNLSLLEFETLATAANQMVDERRQIFASLKDSEEKFRALADTSPSPIFIYQGEHFTYVNPATSQLTGYPHDELMQMKPWEVAHPDMLDMVRERAQNRLVGEDVITRYPMKLLTKDGQIKWIDYTAAPLIYQGNPAVIGNAADITERVKVKDALQAEKERLSVILRSINDGLIVTDLEGRITMINQVAEHLTGWPQAMAVNRPLADIFSLVNEKTGIPLPDPASQLQETGIVSQQKIQGMLISRNGQEKIIDSSAAPLRDQTSTIIGIVIVFRDITEKIQSWQTLQTAKNLESVGLLAGGIAHDFNNLLTSIYGNISLAKMSCPAENKATIFLEKTERSLSRATALTKQLLTFARGGAPVKQIVDVRSLIKETAEFCLRGSRSRLQLELPDNLWPTEVDPDQFSQIINNLVFNANQSMPEGGRLTISAANLIIEAANIYGLAAGKYIQVRVADQGIGIPKEHLGKIFTPYFTTKQEGSGLGLATIYSIIKNHYGHITVDSKIGEGSTFTLFVPAANQQPEGIRESQDAILQPASGRILIMDDDQIIQEVGGEMLQLLGYSVDYADDGQQAVGKYRQSLADGSPFDLVIMDLTIPGGMGGKEAIAALLDIDPHAKAIVSSGYSQDDVMANFKDYGFQGVVAKPYIISELAKVVQAVINDGKGNSPNQPGLT
ncbi:MAG: cache domain-containing protein [Deltaproteobacteria bacterium]|nr:cache domain-containing protein [Candidatus Anaeroferrophillus wilburensis]MBN2887873.1 cache domain-containing protein [Deltaproteobacteria bacterium]